MAGEKSAFDDAYAKARKDRNKDEDTQKADASALDRAQKALVGKSEQEKAYSGAASKARALKAQDYTKDSYGRLDALLTDGFDSGSATGKELDTRANAVSAAIDALEVSSWTVDGATLTQEDGEWTGHVTLDGAPKDVRAVGADGRTVDLKAAGGSFVQGSGKLGVGVVSGTLTGSAPRASFKVAYEYADGTETTVSDGGPGGGAVFSKGDDGVWSATYAGTLAPRTIRPATTRTASPCPTARRWTGPPSPDWRPRRSTSTASRTRPSCAARPCSRARTPTAPRCASPAS